MLSTAVITAPGRHYLSETLQSYRRYWDVTPHIFSEPGVKQLDYGHWHYNPVTLGAVRNWLSALKVMLNYSFEYLMICEDDATWKQNVVGPSSAETLRCAMLSKHPFDVPLKELGFISPYCSRINTFKLREASYSWHEPRMPTWGWCGALCILMPRHFAELVASRRKQFIEYASEKTKTGTPIHLDYAIGEMAKRNSLKIITHTPSLIQHIGEESTFAANNTKEGKAHKAMQPAE